MKTLSHIRQTERHTYTLRVQTIDHIVQKTHLPLLRPHSLKPTIPSTQQPRRLTAARPKPLEVKISRLTLLREPSTRDEIDEAIGELVGQAIRYELPQSTQKRPWNEAISGSERLAILCSVSDCSSNLDKLVLPRAGSYSTAAWRAGCKYLSS